MIGTNFRVKRRPTQARMRQRKRIRSHTREICYILGFAAALLVFLFGVIGPGGYLEMRQAEQRLAEQRARVEKLRRTIAEQMQAIESLKNDPAVLEEYLRKQGFARDGELIQEIPSPPVRVPR